ncbi:MFS transporter [Oryzifoliimicrobium ureilyticus]|uniref:MFS transporter n=1 Tax=Oryzifoliimicrobium ureilyticus TaxID=3113724 RepID=UPI003076214D
MSLPITADSAEKAISPAMTFLFAAACGLVVANIYYGQPLAGPIARSLGFPSAMTGLIVTSTQIGYGLGLFFIVPLGDLIENRRLVLGLVILAALALLAAGFSATPALFLLASLLIGGASVAVQVLVPFAAHMASHETRGRVVGNVMSGLLTGIMLARPAASFLAEATSWHVVYFTSAALMLTLSIVLRLTLPDRTPHTRLGYGALLASMVKLALTEPVLQRRALYQCGMFGAFSLFWTTTPLLLAGQPFGLTQNGIALFALAGAAGAVASPIVGRLADKGLSKAATAMGMLFAILAFLMAHFLPDGSAFSLAILTLAAILLDFGVTSTMVSGQRAVYAISAEHRSRLNGLYMTAFFIFGALGSAVGGWAFATGGWWLTSLVGLALPSCAFLFFLTERKSS